jgi:DNA-binding MarR family transcriptional regulator
MGGNDIGGPEPRPSAAALVRRPALLARHEVMRGLREAGFPDILPAHLGVFQHPGPEGRRPSELAARNSASKQSMNHLLHQLETGGYIVREPNVDDRRSRVVRLTDRGRAAVTVINKTLRKVDVEWKERLGEETYTELRRALALLDSSLEAGQGATSRVPGGRQVR